MVAFTEGDRSSVQRVKFCKSYFQGKAGFIEVKFKKKELIKEYIEVYMTHT